MGKFSVYDGISWYTVTGSTPIEGWTHLAGVFNNASLILYVNGTIDSRLDRGPPEIAGSPANVTIGAYQNTLRDRDKMTSLFSGPIVDVTVYKEALADHWIEEEFRNTLEVYSGFVNGQKVNHTTIVLEESLLMVDTTGKLGNDVKEVDSSPTFSENIGLTDKLSLLVNNQTVLTEQPVVPVNSTNVTLAESIGLSDNIGIRQGVINIIELSDNLGIYDAFIRPTENLTIGESQISPLISPTKQNYLITETPEFEFEFYNETTAMIKDKEDIENVTSSILTQAEQSLIQTEENLVETDLQENKAKSEIAKAKAEIKKLKDKIKNISKQEIDEQTLDELKDYLRKATKQLKSTGQEISITRFIEKGDELDDYVRDIEKETDLNVSEIQKDKWQANNEIIQTEIYDPNGNKLSVEFTFEKLRTGKFQIGISPYGDVKPGIYKLKTTLTVDGQTFVSEDEFAWGLVSLNTKKSIYKPGETIDFEIVVLNRYGHPVCDANLSMNITDPASAMAYLSSENGITPNAECGLYDVQFSSGLEGTHNVTINAKAQGIEAYFSTTFDVRENFEFDIIRTAQSKIDPVSNPNSFDVRIDIESFVGQDQIIIQEFLPSVLEVVTDADVKRNGNTIVLEWNKNLLENKTFVEYTYSVPFDFPQLYALGPARIIYGNPVTTFDEARP